MDQGNSINCPSCQADNQADARFCEQCGAPLDGAGAATEQAAEQGRGSSFRWAALVVLLLIIAALFWVSRNNGKTQEAATPAVADVADNPHASPGGGMNADAPDVAKILEESRSRLAADPLDTEALNEMYDMYAGIGEQARMQPYATAAIEAWLAQDPASRTLKKISDIAMIASDHNDLVSAVPAFIAFHEAQPDNVAVAATIGNLYFQLSRRELPGSEQALAQARQAVQWYDTFLAGATPETQATQYWNVMVDRASMQLSLLDPEALQYDEVIASLRRVTQEAPDFWMGWHNLGLTLKLAGQTEEAIAAFAGAKEHASSPRERWESEQQQAVLENREPDPGDFDPTDPHSGVDMGGTELPGTQPGTPNPHGEGNMPNPHGESQPTVPEESQG